MAPAIDALTLWHGDRAVADLERTSDDYTSLRLRYRPEWQAAADSFAISAGFPPTVALHEGPAVYFWFMNLLPEDDALRTVGQLLEISDVDVLGLVAALGGDLPGALIARAADNGPAAVGPSYRAWTAAELARDIRRLPQRPLLAGEEGVQMSLAGQQAKLPVVKLDDGRLALPLDGCPSTHILKPASAQLHGSVENEAYCMRLARACGLDAAEVEIGEAEDQRYLLVARYDRLNEHGEIRRLHQEDLCQASGLPPYRKYEWNARVRMAGPGAADLFRAASLGPRAAPNRIALLDAFIFNVLVCNIDSHAKNYSLIHRGRTTSLAPLYDVMCGRISEGVTENLPQKIAGKQRGDHVHGRHWRRLAREVGLAPAATRNRVGELARTVLERARDVALAMAPTLARRTVVDSIVAVVEARSRRVIANLDDAATSADV